MAIKQMQRIVESEIFEQASECGSDPNARQRSLAKANFLMGNHRFIERRVSDLKKLGIKQVLELGASDGVLGMKIKLRHPELEVIAAGVRRKPESVHDGIDWREGELCELVGDFSQTVIITNLFLYQLDGGALAKLGEQLGSAAAIICSEPLRAPKSLQLSRLLSPLLSAATRSSVDAGVRAGFLEGELASILGWETWRWAEQQTHRGALRSLALRAEV